MLAAMREAIGELLPDTAQVITITLTPNGQGGHTETRGTASAVACRLDFGLGLQAGREQMSGGGLQPFASYTLSLPYDTVINTNNQVLHGGVTYAVVSVNTNQSWIAVRRVGLEKI
jgi:hypothetical protein